MPRGVHYTPEQKEKMKKRALELLNGGKTQKDVAAEVGTTVTTLRTVIEGEEYPGQRKGGPRKAKGPLAGLQADNPVVQLAVKQQRLAEIDKEIEALAKEKESLQKEMKAIYDKVGKQIFGEK